MYKLDLEKAEEPEIKLPSFIGSWRKWGNSRKKPLLLLHWLHKALWITTICGKFLKRWEYQTISTCLLRNLYASQEAPIRIIHGTMDWFKTGKGIGKAVYCHLAYLTSMPSTSCEMPGWMKLKLESRLSGEISTTSVFKWYHPYGRKWRATVEESLDEGEKGEWKSWLKTQHLRTKIMASSPITSWEIDGEKSGNWLILFPWVPKSLGMMNASTKLKYACSLEEKLWKPRQHFKKQRQHFADKGLYSQTCGFSSSHIWMWELDHKEGWMPKNRCFWTVVLEKTLESPLDCKEIKPVNPKGTQSWIFIGRTDAEAETPVLWLPDTKSWLIGKDPDAGKDWGQEQKQATEDEMVGWHHQLNGHELSKLWEILKDREVWQAAVNGVTKLDTT